MEKQDPKKYAYINCKSNNNGSWGTFDGLYRMNNIFSFNGKTLDPTDIYLIGYVHDTSVGQFARRPEQIWKTNVMAGSQEYPGISDPTNNQAKNAQFDAEIILDSLIIAEGTYSRYGAHTCVPLAKDEIGLNPPVPTYCNTGYYPLMHDKKEDPIDNSISYECGQLPTTNGYRNCFHNLLGYCLRCHRGYGHLGTTMCEACFTGCSKCIGPGSNQCVACKNGYGYSSGSCIKCQSNQAYDHTTDVCQDTKVKFFELNGGLGSEGDVHVRYFNVIETDIILNSFWFRKYFGIEWLTNITDNYYIYRDYENLPQHRKISIT